MRTVIALASLLATAPAHAGKIADLFSDGIFGLPWGASRMDIVERFPSGKWKKEASIATYIVQDRRTVLRVERGKKDNLLFTLNSEGVLVSVGVEFSGDIGILTMLLQRGQEAFGPIMQPDLGRTRTQLELAGANTMEWEIDEGIKVVLVNQIVGFDKETITLGIAKTDLSTTKSKQELGFE